MLKKKKNEIDINSFLWLLNEEKKIRKQKLRNNFFFFLRRIQSESGFASAMDIVCWKNFRLSGNKKLQMRRQYFWFLNDSYQTSANCSKILYFD